MSSLISAILAFLAALAVAVSPTPTPTPQVTETVSSQTVYDAPTGYRNCPQQITDSSGHVHVNDGYDLEFPEFCRIWEYEHNATPTPEPTGAPEPTSDPRVPTNTPAP